MSGLGDRRAQRGSEGPRKIGGPVGSMDRDDRCDGRDKIPSHRGRDKAVSGQAAVITAMLVFVGLMVRVLMFNRSVVDRFILRPIGEHPVSDEITGTKEKGNEKPEHG